MKGRILKGIGGFYYVKTENGIIECKPRGIFRKNGTIPVAGDIVDITVIDENTGVIDAIGDRKNYLIRPPIANIDQLFIVLSSLNPTPDTYFADKITVIADKNKIDTIIVINKIDLDKCENIKKIYESSGFKVISISAVNNYGTEMIKELTSEKVSAFTGFSGVGKSSILQSIYPELTVETGEVSNKIGRGRHTTREVQLFETNSKGFIADTPGFSSLDIIKYVSIKKNELADYFRDFLQFKDYCRFTGCSHTKEKGCAVIEAVSSGKIVKSRYDSYIRLYDELKLINDWENR